MAKYACWRGKCEGYASAGYSLWNVATKRELTEFGYYSSWDTPKAEAASEPIAAAIEEKAKAAGYTIVENPWD